MSLRQGSKGTLFTSCHSCACAPNRPYLSPSSRCSGQRCHQKGSLAPLSLSPDLTLPVPPSVARLLRLPPGDFRASLGLRLPALPHSTVLDVGPAGPSYPPVVSSVLGVKASPRGLAAQGPPGTPPPPPRSPAPITLLLSVPWPRPCAWHTVGPHKFPAKGVDTGLRVEGG